jgi:quercetin dioxygenase-like cupin family protein
MAMGTQLLPGGEQIPVHSHEQQDEILFIHEGQATGIVGDSSMTVTSGTTIFIPRGVWHGVRNPQQDPVKIVWVVAPPGLEGYFRSIGLPPDAECVPLPADELAEIRPRHGISQKIE